MKRSLSAPCLADESDLLGSKKTKEDNESDEPTGREYLQLALARVLELQRQVKDETYSTDATSDLGESDSEEDVMREVLIKVFKDLPGSSGSVGSIINRATKREHPQIRAMKDKRIELSGYDTCRKVALEFMNSVVKDTPITNDEDLKIFERGKYSIVKGKLADHKKGLKSISVKGENSPSNCSYKYANKNRSIFDNIVERNDRKTDADTVGNENNFPGDEINVSKDYEIRVRMLKGLDLHLATKQRDFTARLMRRQ